MTGNPRISSSVAREAPASALATVGGATIRFRSGYCAPESHVFHSYYNFQ